MNKKLMAAISMILVFSFLFAFTGCDTKTEEEESTTVITAKTPLPTDITTSFDEENSEVITDTTYSADMLEANTDKIFAYFNTQINLLKSGVKAKIEMSQSKGINKSYQLVELNNEEVISLVNTVLGEETPADFSGDLAKLSDEQKKDVENYAISEGYTVKNDGAKMVVIKREDIPMSDNDYINSAIKTLDSYMLDESGYKIDEYVDVAPYLPVAGESYVSALTREDVKSATCIDKDGQRVITLTLKGHEFPEIIEKEIIEKAYNVETIRTEGNSGEEMKDKPSAKKTVEQNIDDIMAEFEKSNKYLTAAKPTLTYKDCQIIITVNLETDEVHTIEYKKNVDVKTEVTGQGSLEEMGTVPVAFSHSSTVRYTIERPVPETAATEA